ncbi:hypothetical protein ANN_11039 [Periplaneta americana]|uniref:Uncharacterized protein n=1 Tax=Periplaneta americana TaxID=6978 RepID=A0ABQ8T4L4_PERAM|nr:hypothetical protein ANN_11039 [Periplaneta americana]
MQPSTLIAYRKALKMLADTIRKSRQYLAFTWLALCPPQEPNTPHLSLASLRPRYIKFPDAVQEDTIIRDFYEIAHFPSVLRATDYTHIEVQSPGGDRGELYRNRKVFFSISVQAICDSKLMIRTLLLVDLVPFMTVSFLVSVESEPYLKLKEYVKEFYSETVFSVTRTTDSKQENSAKIPVQNSVMKWRTKNADQVRRLFMLLLLGFSEELFSEHGKIVRGRRMKCIRLADDMALIVKEETLREMLMKLIDRTVSSQFTARLSWLVLLAQSLAFTESRNPDLQRRSAELRTQVPQLRSTALEFRASGSTVTDTTQIALWSRSWLHCYTRLTRLLSKTACNNTGLLTD